MSEWWPGVMSPISSQTYQKIWSLIFKNVLIPMRSRPLKVRRWNVFSLLNMLERFLTVKPVCLYRFVYCFVLFLVSWFGYLSLENVHSRFLNGLTGWTQGPLTPDIFSGLIGFDKSHTLHSEFQFIPSDPKMPNNAVSKQLCYSSRHWDKHNAL